MPQEATSATNPKISVLMVTYNHERYIAKALESVFAQQHPYSLEVVVGDDASTDRTAGIIASFQQKHPEIIRYIRHTLNVGHSRNYLALLEACRGEYIALLDGDDYWTDPLKLKKQVTFLDEHPDFVLSCHRFRQHYLREDRMEDDLYPELYKDNREGFVINPDLFFSHWVVQTLTVMVRRSAIVDDLPGFRSYEHFTDMHIFFSALRKGKGCAHGFFGGVYNMHGDGLWSKLDRYQQFEFNLNILADLIKTHPNDNVLCQAYLVLCQAYLVHKRTLIWMDCGRILQKRESLRSLSRILPLLARLGISHLFSSKLLPPHGP